MITEGEQQEIANSWLVDNRKIKNKKLPATGLRASGQRMHWEGLKSNSPGPRGFWQLGMPAQFGTRQ